MEQQKINKVAIIGSVGVPAKYGGFETLVENLLINKSNLSNYYIYCSGSNFSNKKKKYLDSKLFYIPLKANGIQGIVYDIISLLHATTYSNRMLILGVSGAICLPIVKLFYKGKIIVNIDGIESRRKKWNLLAKKFLKFSEFIAVKFCDEIISDNQGISNYIEKEYKKKSNLIEYGGDNYPKETSNVKIKLPEKFFLKICRIEPENNIDIVLKSFLSLKENLIIIGNWNNSKYGRNLKEKFKKNKNIFFLDPIYDINTLDFIRKKSFAYIHGHSAGGSNPSLIEAMFQKKPIIAYDINFNKYTLDDKGLFFKNEIDLIKQIKEISIMNQKERNLFCEEIFSYASKNYLWKIITKKYEKILI